MMVDPAVGVRPGVSTAYDRGEALGIWMKNPNGTNHLGSTHAFFVSLFDTNKRIKLSGLEWSSGRIGSTP